MYPGAMPLESSARACVTSIARTGMRSRATSIQSRKISCSGQFRQTVVGSSTSSQSGACRRRPSGNKSALPSCLVMNTPDSDSFTHVSFIVNSC
eukprot:3230869-Rhodomonas_salina.1